MTTQIQLKPIYRFLTALSALCVPMTVGCSGDFEGDAMSPSADEADSSNEEASTLGQLTSALAEQTCGQSICSEGLALPASCDPCVSQICAGDPFCCTNSWDAQCVDQVASVCGIFPAAIQPTTLIAAAQLTIRTGGDDLRGGSRALGSFQLTSGASLPQVSLNNGQGYAGGSVHTATIPFTPARPRSELAAFNLEWDGAPRNLFDTYDNWNADQIEISLEALGRNCPTRNVSFVPGRMTGAHTFASTPLAR